MTPPTAQQLRLHALATAAAAANPDAAEYLAEVMLREAKERKRVRCFGIEIRVNAVTGRAEVRGPGD